MSKKVLIIRPVVYVDDKQLRTFSKDVSKSLEQWGLVMLPQGVEYEFGEIDGVVWEGEKKEEPKPNVNWDYLIDYIDVSKKDVSTDLRYNTGWNDGLDVAKRLLLRAKDEEKSYENLRNSEN